MEPELVKPILDLTWLNAEPRYLSLFHIYITGNTAEALGMCKAN